MLFVRLRLKTLEAWNKHELLLQYSPGWTKSIKNSSFRLPTRLVTQSMHSVLFFRSELWRPWLGSKDHWDHEWYASYLRDGTMYGCCAQSRKWGAFSSYPFKLFTHQFIFPVQKYHWDCLVERCGGHKPLQLKYCTILFILLRWQR